MFKKIMVALDGSEPSEHGLKSAASLAASQDAELVLFHSLLRNTPLDILYAIVKRHDLPESIKTGLDDIQVIPTVTAYGAASATAYVVVPSNALGKLAEAYLDKAETIAKKAGVKKVAKVITDGDPAQDILHQTEKLGVDLLVIGSRGLGDLKSMFLGSVSHKVAQQSAVPCLIVK